MKLRLSADERRLVARCARRLATVWQILPEVRDGVLLPEDVVFLRNLLLVEVARCNDARRHGLLHPSPHNPHSTRVCTAPADLITGVREALRRLDPPQRVRILDTAVGRRAVPLDRPPKENRVLHHRTAELVTVCLLWGEGSGEGREDLVAAVEAMPPSWRARDLPALLRLRGAVIARARRRAGPPTDVRRHRTAPAADVALAAGRIARDELHQPRRAMLWFRVAYASARAARDRVRASRALGGAGRALKLAGSHERAMRLFERAYRIAGEGNGGAEARQAAAYALHDLAASIIETEDSPRGYELAARAFALYSSDDPYSRHLAHDIGFWWMERGDFALARRAFEAVLPHMHTPRERMLVLGNTAKAVGNLGDEMAYTRVARDLSALLLSGMHPGAEAATAYLHLAEGAAALRLWKRARVAVEMVETIRHTWEPGEWIREEYFRVVAAAIEQGVAITWVAPQPRADKEMVAEMISARFKLAA